MDEEKLKTIAAQLRQPSGEYAIEVGKKMNEGNHDINLYTIKALNLKMGDNILEIGMGNGLFIKNIVQADNTITYTGLDFSEIMIDEAEKLNEIFVKSGQVKFILGNAEKLPFENELFDKIFSVNTIYFWDQPGLVLSEIHRVLKPGGQIIISIRPKSVMQHYPFAKYGFSMFTKYELENLLTDNNFRVTTTLEKEEPNLEMGDEKMMVETLVVCADRL